MRLVLQRVSEASVAVEGKKIAQIGQGILLLMGIHAEDEKEPFDKLLQKLIHLRIFEDEGGKMNRSLVDIQGEILVVSQFTLYADCSKGRRPAFIDAAHPSIAEPIYRAFIESLKNALGKEKVQEGKFGAEMQVALINDGPVTILLP